MPVLIRFSIFIAILLIAFAWFEFKDDDFNPDFEKVVVDSLLTDWHDAAAKADFTTYFGLMSEESIFMGTDETEYWTKQEFIDYAKPYFDKGKAWTFRADTRRIYFNANLNVAWFDEELITENLGRCRGSGVLEKEDGLWKIAHYNLSLPIPNGIIRDVIQQIDKQN